MSKTLETAQKASRYAREHIIKGSTQLGNNSLTRDYRQALDAGVNDIRQHLVESGIDDNAFNSARDFKKYTEILKKYSLGNCMEMAHVALDYVLDNSPDLPAEIYFIQGGDHIFLVLGREADSDPGDPLSWGNDAVFCDPWSGLAYPAREYMNNLQNFKLEPDYCILRKMNGQPNVADLKGYNYTSYIITDTTFYYYNSSNEVLEQIELTQGDLEFLQAGFEGDGDCSFIPEETLAWIEDVTQHSHNRFVNMVEPFDPERHKLRPIEGQSLADITRNDVHASDSIHSPMPLKQALADIKTQKKKDEKKDNDDDKSHTIIF